MAEIPIERSTRNLWVYIGALVLLGLGVWAAVELFGRRDAASLAAAATPVTAAPVTAAPVAVTPAPAASGAPAAVDPTPLTELAVLVVPQRLPLVGRTVRLIDVPVLSVPGDSVFWVGTDAAHRMMVVLDETLPSGVSTDAWVNVDPGQRVNLTGVVRPLPADLAPWRSRLGLSAADVDALRRDGVYLAAQGVVITGTAGR